jgi:anti-sigma B factor antagonist
MNLGDVEVRIEDSALIARLIGEIDLSNAKGIEEAIARATPNHAAAIILDLTDLEYIDSAGIGLIYRLREKLQVRGQDLKLVIPSDSPAADALRLAGVAPHLPITGSIQEARG